MVFDNLFGLSGEKFKRVEKAVVQVHLMLFPSELSSSEVAKYCSYDGDKVREVHERSERFGRMAEDRWVLIDYV